MSQTEQLQARVKDARDHLQSTVEELRDRFSPAEATRQGLDYVQREGGAAVRKTMETVESHPLAFALMGAGLAWLLLAPTRQEQSQDQDHDDGNARRGSDADGGFGDNPYGDAEQQRRASGTPLHSDADDDDEASALLRGVRRSGRVIRQTSASVGTQISHTVQTRPLTVAAVGLGLGALIAALLPATEFETNLAGDARQQITRRAASGLSAAGERAATAAEHLAETAREELRGDHRANGAGSATEPSSEQRSAEQAPA